MKIKEMMTSIVAVIILSLSLSLNAQQQEEIIFGSHVWDNSNVNEMVSDLNANAVGLSARTIPELVDMIRTNKNITSVIDIRSLIMVDGDVSLSNALNVLFAIDSIPESERGRIVWMYDEPLWYVAQQCINGSERHCNEVNTNFKYTLSQLEIVDALYNSYFGTESFHVEAYAVVQYTINRGWKLELMKTSRYLGMNCYTGFESCGDSVYGFNSILNHVGTVYNTIMNYENTNPMNRKLALVVGTFTSSNITLEQSLEYMDGYLALLDHPLAKGIVGMVAFFVYDSLPGLDGMGSNELVRNKVDQFRTKILSWE